MAGATSFSRVSRSLFIVIFVTYAYFFQGSGHNEAVRLDLTRAIVESGSFIIDRYAFNTADGIRINNHYYSGKAPGLSLFAIPSWVFFFEVGQSFFSTQMAEQLASYLTVVFTISLTSALFAIFLYYLLSRMLENDRLALFLTFAYAFGTIAFPFSTLFFSHQFSAVLIGFAFGILFLLREASRGMVSRQRCLLILAGFLTGFAITTEYPLALAVIPLAVYACHTTRSWRSFIPFAIGTTSGIGILLIYNYLAFSDPFFITYAAYLNMPESFSGHSRGFLGIAYPSLRVLYQITFEPQRGLFVCNPWLILVLPALILSALEKKYRAEVLLSLFMVVLFFLFNASFTEGIVYAGGGASLGARHVIPALPFATIAIGLLIRRWVIMRYLFYSLAFISVAIMLMATATEPRVPYEYTNPVVDHFWAHYLRGVFATNRSGIFNNVFLTADSVSFNWGKLAGLPAALQLVALLVFWMIMIWIFRAREIFTRTNAICISLLLFLLAGAPGAYALWRMTKNSGAHGLIGRYMEKRISSECPESFSPTQALSEELLYERLDLDLTWENLRTHEVPLLIEWKGSVNLTKEGNYHFRISSDDGACLYLNGALVVDNGGEHLPQFSEGAISLTKGEHPVAIRYFNIVGGSDFSLEWQLPGAEYTSIPSEMWIPSTR